jgi:hypothetical protein
MENIMMDILKKYPKNKQVKHCANKLQNGVNLNASKDLEYICSLSYWLYVIEDDVDLALKVNEIVRNEVFDGNYQKWTWLEAIYQLSGYLSKGDEYDFYVKKLKSPFEILDDEKKKSLYLKTVDRRLNDSNLNFKEIQTAVEKKDVDSEINWRKGQILKLIFIVTYGNSQVYSFEKLKMMIDENINVIKKLSKEQ